MALSRRFAAQDAHAQSKYPEAHMKLFIAAFLAAHALIHLSYPTPAPPRTAGGLLHPDPRALLPSMARPRHRHRRGAALGGARRGAALRADMTAIDRELDEHWIVCLAETRAVRMGRVACPLRDGRAAASSQCADCRLLEWQRDERRNGNSCSTVPRVTNVGSTRPTINSRLAGRDVLTDVTRMESVSACIAGAGERRKQ